MSITGAPAGVVLQGNSISLTAATNGGTGPFTYAWTKNGLPFATTQNITDTPGLGSTTYAVTVTDSLGAVSNTASTVVQVYNFTVAGSPTSQQVLTTGSNTYAITEALVAGSPITGLPTIGLSLSGLPSGATASFIPASGTAGGFTSTLTITTANAPPGTYPLTLTGTDAEASDRRDENGIPEPDDPHSCPGHPAGDHDDRGPGDRRSAEPRSGELVHREAAARDRQPEFETGSADRMQPAAGVRQRGQRLRAVRQADAGTGGLPCWAGRSGSWRSWRQYRVTPNGSSDHAEGGPATAGPPSFELGRAHISFAPVSVVVFANELDCSRMRGWVRDAGAAHLLRARLARNRRERTRLLPNEGVGPRRGRLVEIVGLRL